MRLRDLSMINASFDGVDHATGMRAIKVVTWNVLQAVFADPSFYPCIPPTLLDFSARQQIIHESLMKLLPDIIFFQEMNNKKSCWFYPASNNA